MLESLFAIPLPGLKPTVDLSHSQDDWSVSLPASPRISARVSILVDYRWWACEQPRQKLLFTERKENIPSERAHYLLFLPVYLGDGGLMFPTIEYYQLSSRSILDVSTFPIFWEELDLSP